MPEAQATQETFVDRLRAELEHLKARIWKLNEFIVGAPAFNTLEHEDRQLLIAQKNAMESYLKILKARLERATSKSSLAAD